MYASLLGSVGGVVSLVGSVSGVYMSGVSSVAEAVNSILTVRGCKESGAGVSVYVYGIYVMSYLSVSSLLYSVVGVTLGLSDGLGVGVVRRDSSVY